MFSQTTLVPHVIGGEQWRLADRPVDFSARDSYRRNTGQKVLLALAAVISAVLMLGFGADAFTGWPFLQHSLLMDTTYLACGIVLGYLTWHAYRELR